MEELNLKTKLALKRIKDFNVNIVEVHYSGGGDDGCIDCVLYKDIDDKPLENLYGDLDKVTEDIEGWLYDTISNNIEWDWINNEGGYGVLTISLGKNGDISIDHTQRVTEDFTYQVDEDVKILNLIDGTS